MSAEHITIQNTPSLEATIIEAGPAAWPAVVSPEIEGFFERNNHKTNIVDPVTYQNEYDQPATWQIRVTPPLAESTVGKYVEALQDQKFIPFLALKTRSIVVLDYRSVEPKQIGCIKPREEITL